jgi:hypothetical protein
MAEDFEYKVTTEDTGEIFTLHLKPSARITLGIMEEIWEAQATDKPTTPMLLDWALSAEERAITKRVPIAAIGKLMEAWQSEDDGINSGESKASTTSSVTAVGGRRSKRTSSASDSD